MAENNFWKLQDREANVRNEWVLTFVLTLPYMKITLVLTHNDNAYLQLWEHCGIIIAILKYSKQIPHRSKSSIVWNAKIHIYLSDRHQDWTVCHRTLSPSLKKKKFNNTLYEYTNPKLTPHKLQAILTNGEKPPLPPMTYTFKCQVMENALDR